MKSTKDVLNSAIMIITKKAFNSVKGFDEQLMGVKKDQKKEVEVVLP